MWKEEVNDNASKDKRSSKVKIMWKEEVNDILLKDMLSFLFFFFFNPFYYLWFLYHAFSIPNEIL